MNVDLPLMAAYSDDSEYNLRSVRIIARAERFFFLPKATLNAWWLDGQTPSHPDPAPRLAPTRPAPLKSNFLAALAASHAFDIPRATPGMQPGAEQNTPD